MVTPSSGVMQGPELAGVFLAALSEPDGLQRMHNISGLYRTSPRPAWRRIDAALVIERDERVRLAALRGLARRLGSELPPTPTAEQRLRESRLDFGRDRHLRRMYETQGRYAGTNTGPTHAAQAGSAVRGRATRSVG